MDDGSFIHSVRAEHVPNPAHAQWMAYIYRTTSQMLNWAGTRSSTTFDKNCYSLFFSEMADHLPLPSTKKETKK